MQDEFNPNKFGDRTKLSRDHRELLEVTVIPTALRWLKNPALADHGLQTLNYWKEPIPAWALKKERN